MKYAVKANMLRLEVATVLNVLLALNVSLIGVNRPSVKTEPTQLLGHLNVLSVLLDISVLLNKSSQLNASSLTTVLLVTQPV